MTGVLNAMVANRGTVRVSVGVGNSGASYGFIITSLGTVTPSAYAGANIRNLVSDTNVPAGYDLQIVLEGTLPQNFFAGVVVETTAGTFRTFLTSAANAFQQLAGTPDTTLWNWDTNTAVFTSTTPSPRSVQFF